MWLDFDPQLGHEQSGRRPHAGRPHTGAVLPKKTESIQRMIVRRALAGQCPTNPEQIIQWLEATARGWNGHPAPYMWGGERKARRDRTRSRKHSLGGSGACSRQVIS